MKKVLALGNALVDIMTKLENDEFLKLQNLPKGSMQLVNLNQSAAILNAASSLSKSQASGGSSANTIRGLAMLGGGTGYIGKVGKDDLGNFFCDDMKQCGIEPKLLMSSSETGRAIALISPDSERTFATYLGAAVELTANDLTSDMFKGYAYFHMEGYLVLNPDLVMKAVKLAKENNMKVSLDLASYNVVKDNLDFLTDLARDYVDIVFANEEEAKAFTGKEPEEALHAIAELCEIAIVKIGSKGSMIKCNGKVTRVNAINANSVDTTGAGDLYAAGFLYGLTNEMPLLKCGDLGSLLSGKVIEVIGSKMTDSIWNEIRKVAVV